MQYRIESSSGVPIYRQIVGQIRTGVARGLLLPGEKLPTVREMSRILLVNPNTVARSYQELEREGILVTRHGLGVFVAEMSREISSEGRERRLREAIDLLLTEAVHLGFSRTELVERIEELSGRYQWPGEITTDDSGR